MTRNLPAKRGSRAKDDSLALLGLIGIARGARIAHSRCLSALYARRDPGITSAHNLALSDWRVFGGANRRLPSKIADNQSFIGSFGGGGWIRTSVGLPRRIYSPLHLTALPPLQGCVGPEP